MASDSFRWLHVSDFHVGSDDFGHDKMTRSMLEHVKNRTAVEGPPDAVFITGDIANKGKPSEYKRFEDTFLFPLREIVEAGTDERIYIVPGNHDLDRGEAEAVQRYGVLDRLPKFLDPTPGGQKLRSALMPRFLAFTNSALSYITQHWVTSQDGFYTDRFEIKGLRIGILGLNTAWLSEGDDDRGKLTPGKDMLAEGLNKLEGVDLKFVLAHHPIDWLIEEHADPIRTLLARGRALYLHGHRHKTRAQYDGTGTLSFLALQAGAAFQGREEDQQRPNRLLWCEIGAPAVAVRVDPRAWSMDNQEWTFDAAAFPSDCLDGAMRAFLLPLPAVRPPINLTAPVQVSPPQPLPPQRAEIPRGWIRIDADFLDQRRVVTEPQHILAFFNGREPIWREALSPIIPRREVVLNLRAQIGESLAKSDLYMWLILGAGGEGKTTALRQVVCDLVLEEKRWNVVWHNDSEAPLPLSLIDDLPITDHPWLIVSDDVDLIAPGLFRFAAAAHAAGRTDIRLLVSARDTDWFGVGADQLHWEQHIRLRRQRMRGLSAEDADRIVAAWGQLGEEGLGRLAGVAPKDAARRLFDEARSDEYEGEGAFLGAMLRFRMGQELRSHVKALLIRLKARQVFHSAYTLMDALGYIAAMHSENQLFLSKIVLAEALGGTASTVKRHIIGPLGDEAAAEPRGQFVLVRHRAIAETVVDILSNDYHVDFDEIFAELFKAALRVFSRHEFVPHIDSWHALSRHFADRGDYTRAISMERARLLQDPNNEFAVARVANLFRDAGQPTQAVVAFRDAPSDTPHSRAYLNEWATCEGESGKAAIDGWLLGVALADQTERAPPDREAAKRCLAGFGVAMQSLAAKYDEVGLVSAVYAAGYLGLRLKVDDPKANSYFRNYLAADNASARLEPTAVFEVFRKAVTRAWELREDDSLPNVPTPDALTWHSLARLLKIRLTVEA